MALTEADRIAFIKEIAPCAQHAYKVIGKVLPSICIGMACVESGYGSSKIMRQHNAFMGQKCGSGKTATKYWDKTFFTTKTKEEYQVGVHTVITDAFRSYKDTQQCIMNYYELLNTKLYSRVQAGVDYETQMRQIKQCGYMTSSTEVNSVINLIKKYNLTQYDGESNNDYIIGKTYALQSDMYVRKEPNGDRCEMKDLTKDGQKNAFEDDEGFAVLKKGTKITCKDIKALNAIWVKAPSGWICARSVSGKVYVA